MTRPVKNLSGLAATGDAAHFGTNDLDQVNNLFTGQDQSSTDPIDMNTSWKYRHQKLIFRDPTNTYSATVLSPAITADKSFYFDEPTYDYYIFKDPVTGVIKAKHNHTNCMDYTDANYLDPVIASILTGYSNSVTIRLSPDIFTINSPINIPATSGGASIIKMHGSLGSRQGRATVLQAANNATNLNNHSFFESLGGTNGTNLGPNCEIAFMGLYNPNFTTQSMGGIAFESDIFYVSYAGMSIHDVSLYYASASKGGIYLKGKGFPYLNNIFSSDSSANYVGTTDFCFVGGGTDATGGQLANDHGDGLIHAQISNLHTSHTGTGVQGAGGSMQHTLWVGLKYGKLSHLGFDGWGFRDDPIVIKDSFSCVINDIHHQDMNVVDTGNVGDCGILLYSSDPGGATNCWGNRLYNMRLPGWPIVNKTNIKCDGAAGVGPQHNYIELEEYGSNLIRINELHGSYNVFALKPGSHTTSFSQAKPTIDNLQATSRIIDQRGAAVNGGSVSQNGNGTTTAFTIPHGLYAAPAVVEVFPGSSDARGNFYLTADATNITVTYPIAPQSGTGNVTLWWRASVFGGQ